MFEYEKTDRGYWIWSEKMTGKFGPFQGIYIKNKILGDFPITFDVSSYPGYKYALGKGDKNIFVLSLEGCQNLLPSISEMQERK